MRMYFKSVGIDNPHLITRLNDYSFIFLIQRATLLGLKEAGGLTEMQYRQAEEILRQQHREDIRANTTSLKDD